MANFTSKILGTAISSLNAQQAVIANTSSNIANVNTPGYARRELTLESRSSSATGAGINLGGGVDIGQLRRQTNDFIDRVLRNAQGDFERYQVEDQFLERLEPLFSLSDNFNSIGSTMNQFFTALDDLSVSPESIELRANVMQRAEDLIDSIKNTYGTIAELQDEADARIGVEINTINSITSEIATLNGLIKSREAAGEIAPGERDQRDLLLTKLAEKMSFSIAEVNDGTINISLPDGFNLVHGSTASALEFTHSPSFDSGGVPPSLSGQSLGHIVYDYSSNNTGHIELTDVIAGGDGILGGLLAVRGYVDTSNPSNTSAFDANGTLVEVASRVEAISRFLLLNFNTENLGPDRLAGTAGHQPTSADLDGNAPAPFGFFTFAYGGTHDADSDGLPEAADLAASGLDNFSSILGLAIANPREIAAGRSPQEAALNVAPGDNQNVLALAGLQTSDSAFTSGSFSLTGNPGEVYDELVSTVGSRRNTARVKLAVSESNVTTAEARRDEVSAVSLDEEFTDLIKFQRAFEASARVLRIADELLENIVSLI